MSHSSPDACSGGDDREPSPVQRYSPQVSIDRATAHRWAPCTAVITTVDSLTLMSVDEPPRYREVAKEALDALYSHATPFDARRRFPASGLYVCIDRAPFVDIVELIQEKLRGAEVGDRFVLRAGLAYMVGIRGALEKLRRRDSNGAAPLLYDRAAFESVFLLTWGL